MKKGSKMLAVLLALVMVLSICACSDNDDGGKELVGTWGLEYDMADLLAEEMGDEFADFSTRLEMTICFEFTEDGKFTMFGEEASFKANFAAWLDDFVVYGTDVIYAQFETMGTSKEDADALIQQEYGLSVPDFLRQSFESEVDVDALLQSMTISGIYETSGNKLYMAEEGESIDKNAYDVFTVDGNNLKLELPTGVDASEGEILPGLSYPLEFTKR